MSGETVELYSDRRGTDDVRRLVIPLVAGALACGSQPSSSPVGPDAQPAVAVSPPAPPPSSAAVPLGVTIAGTVVDTLTGVRVGEFTRVVPALPALVAVAAPGYVTRDAWITHAAPRVDLFPERGFDLAFYRQLARNDLERGAAALDTLSVLTQPPAFFVETEGQKGFPAPLVARFEQLARQLVPRLSGGRFQVTRWETGPSPRARQNGWIVIERREERTVCGRAFVGALAGQIWLSDHPGCRIDSTFAHELGHAFGFWHVDRPGSMMLAIEDDEEPGTDAPTELEEHHIRLAYSRGRGNSDIDADARAAAARAEALVID